MAQRHLKLEADIQLYELFKQLRLQLVEVLNARVQRVFGNVCLLILENILFYEFCPQKLHRSQ